MKNLLSSIDKLSAKLKMACLQLAIAANFAVPTNAATTYTTQTSNFTSRTQDSPSGVYNSGSNLGIFANSGNGGFQNNQQAVAFRTLTTDGANSGSSALALQVGQSFSVTLSLNGPQSGITGNSIGFSINNGTASASVGDYRAGSRFEYSFTSGDTTAKIYDSGTQTSNLPNFGSFAGGLTYTFTLVSTNEYNFQVSSGGATYNVGTLGGTAAAALQSFSFFNRGYNNKDAIFGSVSVSDLSTIGYTSNTGETKNVTGQITNNSVTSSNNIQKLGVGSVVLQNSNTYTGTTTVSAGTLTAAANGALGSSTTGTSSITVSGSTTQPNAPVLNFTGTALTDRVNNNASLNLQNGTDGVTRSGGTLLLGATADAANTSETLGALTLGKNSVIDFASTSSSSGFKINFTNLTLNSTSTDYAVIRNWNGTRGAVGGANNDGFLFTNLSGFTNNQISSLIKFDIGGIFYDAQFKQISGNNFEIVAVPEPSTWVGAGLITGLIAFSQRKRMRELIS